MNKELKQDLRSLGCPEEIMKELDHTSDEDRKLMLLKKYRKQLLENVHFEQKRLQDLDFIGTNPNYANTVESALR